MTSLRLRQSLAALLALCLWFGVVAESHSQSGEEAAIRALVERYFSAYAREDLEAIGRLWSDKSPDLAQTKATLKEFFSINHQIETKNYRFRKIKVEEDHATALVTLEITAVDPQTNKPQLGLGKRSQNISFVKEAGEWKIQRDASAEAELAARLIAAKSQDERTTLLASDNELLTVELRKTLLQQNRALIRKGSYAQALAVFELAERISEQINDTAGLAQVSIGVGLVRRLQGNLNPSLDSYQKALALCEKLGQKVCSASSLIGIGIIHHMKSDYALASENYRKALALSEELGNKNNIASALNNLGLVKKDSGNYSEALDYFQKSMNIFESLGDRPGMAAGLGNMAIIHTLRGDIDTAITYFHKAFAINEASGDKAALASGLNDLGTTHTQRGNLGEAMSFFQRALAAQEELGNKRGIAYALGNIAIVHYQQGNFALAREYYQKSLALEESLGDKAAMVDGLSNLGLVYSALGDYERALECYQKSLSLSETVRNRLGASSALANIGEAYRSQGNYDLALENYRKSLQLKEELGDRTGTAVVLANMGLAYYQQGNHARAVEMTERAIGLSREIGDRGVLWRALTTAGNTYRALGQPARASEAFREAISTIEDLRADAGGGEQERQQLFEKKVSPYYRMVELLARSDPGEALSYAERAKARVLLDVLRSGKVNITKAMTIDEKAQEQNIRASLVSLNSQLSRENRRSQPDQTRVAQLKTELGRARLDRQDFQSRLYASHPDLKVRRGDAQALTLEEAGKLLTDRKTALVEYAVADEKTFLFVLTANAATRNGLQQPVLKVYDLNIKRKDLVERVQKLNQRIANNDLDYAGLSSELYNLLVAPARQQLQGKTSLVIVPDDILWETSFQALRAADGRFLIQSAAISYAPSLTVLREIVKSRKPKTSTTLLAMGNPEIGGQTISRSKNVLMSASFEPLPDAERMVKELGQMYGAKARVYVRAEAREEALKAESGNYRILQLATHGVINNASPMYSYVVLAQGNNAQEDGLLEAWEIMQLDLRADLAVLSACDTARGRIGAGEGVIGLAWALFVAGCPTTVVSQWKVESSSTTELMLAFHRNLQSGSGKSEALRQASMKLMADKRYNHPFYWAGFIVVGDPQ
jgi:CHAT domain-containing protein/Tfp pilus assembly protein PilF